MAVDTAISKYLLHLYLFGIFSSGCVGQFHFFVFVLGCGFVIARKALSKSDFFTFGFLSCNGFMQFADTVLFTCFAMFMLCFAKIIQIYQYPQYYGC